MKPRERVLEAIHHRTPERVPFSWGFGPTPEMTAQLERRTRADGYSFADLRRETDDVHTISADGTEPELPEGTDVWGVRRKPVSYGAGEYDEIDYHPLARVEDPAALAEVEWPDPDWFDFGNLRSETVRRDPEHTRAHRLSLRFCGNPLERYTWMTGLEQTLVNLLINPELVHAAMQRITGFFLEMMERAVNEVGDYVDIFFFADDLGGQDRLLMAPETYRELVQPYHRRLFARSKELIPGSKAMFHTDGAVFDILPDLIDAGIDILEAVQVDAHGMDPSRLKSAFGESLCFHGGIAVQSLLPHGTADEVRAQCRALAGTLGDGGGYIAAPTHAIQVGTPVENVFAMLEAVLGADPLEAAVARARRR